MISIKLNKELDYEMYKGFSDHKRAGIDFGEGIRKEYPGINLENHKKYIDEFYLKNEIILNIACDELKTALAEKQEAFFDALEKLFGMDFRQNIYTGFISILNCNPRFLESKTFQVFYKKDTVYKIKTVFHEMMHFAFFDYCDKYLSEETKGLDKNSGKLWDLSEIFNAIFLNEPEFRKILDIEEKTYPNLREKYEVSRKVWDVEKDNLSSFIKKAIVAV